MGTDSPSWFSLSVRLSLGCNYSMHGRCVCAINLQCICVFISCGWFLDYECISGLQLSSGWDVAWWHGVPCKVGSVVWSHTDSGQKPHTGGMFVFFFFLVRFSRYWGTSLAEKSPDPWWSHGCCTGDHDECLYNVIPWWQHSSAIFFWYGCMLLI